MRLASVVAGGRVAAAVCLGRNYAEHAAEGGHDVPTHPVLFAKYASSLTGAYDDVPMPRASRMLDWEAELAVVMSRGGRDIAKADALSFVAGYTVSK